MKAVDYNIGISPADYHQGWVQLYSDAEDLDMWVLEDDEQRIERRAVFAAMVRVAAGFRFGPKPTEAQPEDESDACMQKRLAALRVLLDGLDV